MVPNYPFHCVYRSRRQELCDRWRESLLENDTIQYVVVGVCADADADAGVGEGVLCGISNVVVTFCFCQGKR
jgi:hypothetical protein